MTDDERRRVAELVRMLVFVQGALAGGAHRNDAPNLRNVFTRCDQTVTALGFSDPETRLLVGAKLEDVAQVEGESGGAHGG